MSGGTLLLMNAERLRPAAILALRHSLVIFVLAMVIIPFRSLMNRIFDHTWYVNWLAVVEVSGILTMIFICFHFFAQLLEMGMADRRARGNRLVFSAAMWLRGTYLFCIIMGVGLPVGMYREGVRGGVLYIPILFLLLGYF